MTRIYAEINDALKGEDWVLTNGSSRAKNYRRRSSIRFSANYKAAVWVMACRRRSVLR